MSCHHHNCIRAIIERTDDSMFTLNCPECNRVFTNGKELYAKRAMGVHRHNAHGYNSKRDYRKEYREKQERKGLQSSSWWRVDSHEIPIALSECPVCHTKFVAVQPQQTNKKG